MQGSHSMDIYRGRCQELPSVRSKIVRIFLSSTFSDTLSERDSLIESVFPRLKEYCRKNYGLEFQYSDMRWGIPTESSDTHSEVQTCLKEIELCKKYSVATNFVVLLSHRYGSRPTPSAIRASLYDQLYENICSNTDLKNHAELVAQWYQLDTNCVPAMYILRPISTILEDIKSSNTSDMKKAEKEWKQINNRILGCLRQAAALCLQQGKIKENEYDDFFISVTEKEIVNGILTAADANQRTLCFLRDIEDIYEHLSDKKASRFIETTSDEDGNTIVVEETETLLNRLKHTRIPKVLNPENIYSYKVRWAPDGINRRDHAEYISKFNEDFYNAIKQQIDDCVKSRTTIISNPLEHELLEHAIQCRTYVAKFHGRTDVLSKLETYIKQSNEDRPCIVYGDSGCGKTSVLAKVANESFLWLPDRSVSVILRFLGTTPTSSTIYKTLLSISQQICKLYKLPMQNFTDALQLRFQLERDLLMNIPEDEYLIILLDSIDQLEPDAYNCQWLPTVFPKNVKCIVSTLPNHGNILSNLKLLINHSEMMPQYTEHLLVLVPPFDAATVEIVYNDWLTMKQRSLTEEQRSFIRDLMKEQTNILPLYMKLIFDIISIWHSYDPIDASVKKLKTVDDCIRYLFNYLKTIHNSVLFTHALCYMTACRSGISQNELEDVLSLDDEVLKSVFQHYIPPIRRLPGILWTRIRNDLDEYITEKEADDSTVIYWYHRRFIEVANSLYISKLNSEERKNLFQNMIDFYKETWKGKNKPFKIDDQRLVNKYNLSESNGEIQANRFTASQPIQFIDANGRVQFNKRKLNEFPQFVSQLTTNLAIPIAADEIYFNYPFLSAKIICSPFSDIMNDFQTIKSGSSYALSQEVKDIKKELDVLAMFYLVIGAQLQEYPDNFPFEASSRFLGLYGIKPYITRLIKQFDELSLTQCSLIVPYAQHQPPGNGLLFSMNKHTESIVEIDFTDDQVIAISLSDRIVATNMQTIATVSDITLPKLDEPYLNSTMLPVVYNMDENDKIQNTSSSDDTDEQLRNSLFLVNSLHHIYVISTKESIKFEKTSKVGYIVVEAFNKQRGLCVIAEKDGTCVECWSILKNSLFHRIEFQNSTIKFVACIPVYSMIVIVLKDGSIHIYSIKDWKNASFTHCSTIEAGVHLDLATVNNNLLILTFDKTVPTDFAFIDLKEIHDNEYKLENNTILKTLITFDPPIGPKPIKSIILPDKEAMGSKKCTDFMLFIAKTTDSIFVIHKCLNNDISYTRIKGEFDVISMHFNNPNTIYTARGGIIEIYKWKCVQDDNDHANNCKFQHTYQLYVAIDISSSPVTAIKANSDNASIFLCTMENGVFQAYYALHARRAFKSIAPLPRTNTVIRNVELCKKIAVTLDDSGSELTSWIYQHSASIKSTRLFRDGIKINDFAVTSNNLQSNTILVLVLTNNHWAQIYSAEAFNKEPLFTLHLRSPARVHSTRGGNFFLITNKGSAYYIHSRIIANNEISFNETKNIEMKVSSSMMLSSVVTLHSSESLIVFADNGNLMAVWTTERLIYIDISSYPTKSSLKSVSSEPTQNLLLLHFDNKFLISCKVKIDKSRDEGSVYLTSYDKAEKFYLKSPCLATYNHGKSELNLHDVIESTCHEPIQLTNECLQLCLNETATYAFALVKPRVLFMYRIADRQQLAKLFMYDFVTNMKADTDFVVLAMNDRRLLTLMIADPNDPSVHQKIKALPSRNPLHERKSAIANLVKHIEDCADMSSSSEESDMDEAADAENNNSTTDVDGRTKIQRNPRAKSLLRFVTRLNSRHTLQKMKDDNLMRLKAIDMLCNDGKPDDLTELIQDSDDEVKDDDYDVQFPYPNTTTSAHTEKSNLDADLNDIREKTAEHDRKQIKGIQFANAGTENIKVVNNYAVTSNTCTIS